MYNTTKQSEFTIYAVGAGILATLYAVMFYLYPMHNDDLWYTANSHGSVHSYEYFLSTMQNCVDHWSFDTSRLCNMVVGVFLGLTPKWLYALLTSAVVGWILIVGPILTKSRYTSMAAALWVATIAFVFPWIDYMFGIVYSTNYVWTLGLGLSLVWLVFARKSSNTVLIAPLAFVVGWWHEGFSVPLICMLITYLFVKWKRPSRTMTVTVGAMALGLLVLVLIPGLRSQVVERQSTIIKGVFWETLVHTVAFNFIFYIYVAILAVYWANHRTRMWLMENGRIRLAVCLGILAFGTVGTAIYFMYYNGPRTGAFNQVICTLGIMYMTGALRWRKKIALTALTTVMVLALVNAAAAIKVQAKLTREFDYVVEHKDDNINHIVYIDQTPVRLGLDFLKPSYMALNHKNTPYDVTLLPTSIEHFDPTSTMLRPTSEQQIYLYGNNVIGRGWLTDKDIKKLRIEKANGETEYTRVRCTPFRADNGTEWTYLRLTSLHDNSGSIDISDVKIEN